jgi:hypothetical protein
MNRPTSGQTRRDILRWGVASAAATAALPALPGWTGSAAAADGETMWADIVGILVVPALQY